MTFGSQISSRLKRMRRDQRAGQEVVALATGLSISAISRLERALRSLRVDQLVAWSGALGYRVDIVFWEPTVASDRWDPEHPELAMGLDDECAHVLAEVAGGVGHMPPAARQALIKRMRAWREAATTSA